MVLCLDISQHHFGGWCCGTNLVQSWRVSSANNIERFRKERGWARPKLAELMGTSPQQVERLEKGHRKLSQEWINRAAEALGVQPADIITPAVGVALAPLEKFDGVAEATEVVTLQKLDLSLSMGPGTLIDDWVEAEPVAFDRAFLQAITRAPSNRLKLVTGIGDSMYPTLNWGDAIMIDTTDNRLARQDGIYWINLYGAAGIKRLRTVGEGRVLVKSDNPSVDDQEVEADDLRIEGRAIWVARGL
jgi:phage repressor protein C with HTH and peptisase S24 domain